MPISIIIQVAGSGTAAVTEISSRPKSLPEAALTSVKIDKLADVLFATKLPEKDVQMPVEPNAPDVAMVVGDTPLPIEIRSGETFGPPKEALQHTLTAIAEKLYVVPIVSPVSICIQTGASLAGLPFAIRNLLPAKAATFAHDGC